MALNWDDSLLLGNADIDEQHRQLFDHFEKFSLACQEGQGGEVLKELLKYIDEYSSQHFSYEEAFMAQHEYPKLPEQQLRHAQFRETVNELWEMDTKNVDAHQLSLVVYRKLILWFIQHIKNLDHEMVNYILAQQHD